MRKIFFKNSKNQKICGILDEPNSESDEIVIIIHGFSSTKDSGAKYVAAELSKRNINSIRIDLDNRGESEPGFEKATISGYVNTVISTINYFKKLGYKYIMLFGTSLGGLIAMATALRYPAIKKLVLRAPVADYYELLLKRFSRDELAQFKKQGFYYYTRPNGEKLRIHYDFIEDSKKYSMYKKVKNIKCPVLIIHGTKDQIVNYRTSQKLVKGFKNAQLVLIKNADHGLSINGDLSQGLKVLANWFEK